MLKTCISTLPCRIEIVFKHVRGRSTLSDQKSKEDFDFSRRFYSVEWYLIKHNPLMIGNTLSL